MSAKTSRTIEIPLVGQAVAQLTIDADELRVALAQHLIVWPLFQEAHQYFRQIWSTVVPMHNGGDGEFLACAARSVASAILDEFLGRLPQKVELSLKELFEEAFVCRGVTPAGRKNELLRKHVRQIAAREELRLNIRRCGGRAGQTLLTSTHILELLLRWSSGARMFRFIPKYDRSDSAWIESVRSTEEYVALNGAGRATADGLVRAIAACRLRGKDAQPRIVALKFAASQMGLSVGTRHLLRIVSTQCSENRAIAAVRRHLFPG